PDATPMNSNSGAVCACDASTAALICDGTPFNDSCGSPVCTGSMVCTPAANCGDPTHALGVNGQPLGGGCVCKPGFFNNPAAPPGSQCVPCPAGTYKSAA